MIRLINANNIIISFICFSASTLQDVGATRLDSMRVELNEVSVEASMQHTSPTETSYIPDKRVKAAAQNAIDLLRLSAIPQIVINGESVSTISGQTVDIFINYMPATNEDIQGLRTKDVRRIEYLDFPTDPRFRNAQHAVNIIVTDYVYGGYTKLAASQWLLGSSTTKGSAYSKFVYKHMTYDAFAALDRVDSKHVASASSSSFNLPSGTITRTQCPLSSQFAYYSVPFTLRATYTSDKVQVRNTIGFSLMNRHTYEQSGQLNFSPELSTDYNYRRSSPYRTSSLSWYGNYYFALPKDCQLTIDPHLAYNHNNSYSNYSSTLPNSIPIINNAKENAYQMRLNTKIAKQLQRHNINLNITAGSIINKIDYWGSNSFQTKFSNSFFGPSIGYALNLNKVYINADGGLLGEFQRTNGIKYDDWYPFAHLSASYAWNRKNQAQIWAQYATSSPGASMRTPGMIQSNEFLYTAGNPFIENARHTTLYLGYTLMPVNKFMATIFSQYYKEFDRSISKYDINEDGYGIIQSYINNGNYSKVDAGAQFALRLLKNSMSLQVAPTYSNCHSTGYLSDTRNMFSCKLSWQYYIGAFNFYASYITRTHAFNASSGEYFTNRSNYSLQVGWANADWNLRLTGNNIFRTRYDGGWSVLTTPLYNRQVVSYNGNYRASLSLSATYTFGYGKQVKRNNEVGAQYGTSSAILE